MGADTWRRTGVLTFDGNANLKDTCNITYTKIQKHLEEVYGRHFAYGTVIELCVPRNKHRRSSKRYRGLAKVTSRRARKGFCIRYNPDMHWSASFYKGLQQIQYVDGRNILNINRDDATGFRLDTLTTCKQYTNPTVQGKEILTTRTDYVNKHPSVLQTTSYNFTQTNTTLEVCVGVVKAVPIHKKNPTHFSDLLMLSVELQPVFHNKEIDCIRVDGASDEGSGHELVQYWWTEWHFLQKKVVTLVTTHCSGSSFLNRVELQNGCLSLGHSNTFIPSTLGGIVVLTNKLGRQMKPHYEKTSTLQSKPTLVEWMVALVVIQPSSCTRDLNQKNIMQSVVNLTPFLKDPTNRGNSCERKILTSFHVSP